MSACGARGGAHVDDWVHSSKSPYAVRIVGINYRRHHTIDGRLDARCAVAGAGRGLLCESAGL